MLALTRRVGEEVVIGDPSSPQGVIRVVSIQGDKVRLSFDFPHEIEINRKELAEQKRLHGRNEQRRSGNGSNDGRPAE